MGQAAFVGQRERGAGRSVNYNHQVTTPMRFRAPPGPSRLGPGPGRPGHAAADTALWMRTWSGGPHRVAAATRRSAPSSARTLSPFLDLLPNHFATAEPEFALASYFSQTSYTKILFQITFFSRSTL